VTDQARWILAAALLALTLGWVGMRRGNAALEARLASTAEARP